MIQPSWHSRGVGAGQARGGAVAVVEPEESLRPLGRDVRLDAEDGVLAVALGGGLRPFTSAAGTGGKFTL